MINSDKYSVCQQLHNLKIAIQKKCPIIANHKKIIFREVTITRNHILQNRSCAN